MTWQNMKTLARKKVSWQNTKYYVVLTIVLPHLCAGKKEPLVFARAPRATLESGVSTRHAQEIAIVPSVKVSAAK